MIDVFLGIGSNVNAEKNLRDAVESLRERFADLRLSAVYQNAPYGFEGDDFLNLVAGLSTGSAPAELVALFENLHERAGRTRGADRFTSRPLDIDLLLYGDLVDSEPPLRVPRKDILEYSFVLRPLAELAPDLVHPVTGSPMSEHWQRFDARSHPLRRVDVIL